MKNKLIRITTVPISLELLLRDQLKFMNNYFDVIAVSSDKSNLERVGKLQGVSVFHLEMTRKITPLKDLKSIWSLYLFLRKQKPTIVHTHTPKAGFVGMIASWAANVPVRLHTVAGLPLMEAHGFRRKILNLVERLTYACASQIYPNSDNLKGFILREQFCPTDKLKVIGNGSSNGINVEEFKRDEKIDIEVEQLRVLHGINVNDFTFVFVGRLVKDKGINELVEAFGVLSRRYNNLKLLLVGPEESELDPLPMHCLNEIHNNPSIIAVGYQSNVKPYLSLSNVLVFPSYREGFPNVPMQAGCFDLPSIVTNINGCNEIIINGKNGLIVPVKDVNALSDSMEQLYLDSEMYNRMKSNARRMIVERYDQHTVWQLILEEYQTHLDSKNIV